MNRRTFLGRAKWTSGPGHEYLPGKFADSRLPIKWTEPPPRRGPLQAIPGDPLNTTTGLEPYVPDSENPWDRRRALHLLRRTAYGVDPDALEVILSKSPGEAVDAIVDAALAAALPPEPQWRDIPVPPLDAPQPEIDLFLQNNIAWRYEVETEVHREYLDLNQAGTAFRERLVMFWHDHFVTSIEVYGLAAWLFRYWRILRKHALGNFKDFVHEIGITPAMLHYLNGVENKVGAPNENYARELMELFTMGIEYPVGTPNYTQEDIQELARTLTGWSTDPYGTLEAVFVPEWHDTGQKTVFGQTGNWGYDDVVGLLFGKRPEAIAHFISTKIYQEFVYGIPSPAVVDEMAGVLLSNDFELEPLLRTLLKSAHFFDSETMGARIKSPIDFIFGMVRETRFELTPEHENQIQEGILALNQEVFEPPSVEGWPVFREWIDTNTLPVRWWYADFVLFRQQTLQGLAMQMPNPYSASELTKDFAEYFLAVPLAQEDLDLLVEILLNGLPPYEWNPTAQGTEGRLFGLVLHLLQLPEYQLT